MLWFKAFHIISMVAWFAGLFYLPRLFVYNAMYKSKSCKKMLNIMQYKLFYYIMNPALISTLFFGLILLHNYNINAGWIYIKIFLTFLLVVYHFYLGFLVKIFDKNFNKKSHRYYRIINEIPTVILILIVICVVLKPF